MSENTENTVINSDVYIRSNGKLYKGTSGGSGGGEVVVVDFSTVFDFAAAIANADGYVTIETPLAAAYYEQLQNDNVKIKIAFNGDTAILNPVIVDFGHYCSMSNLYCYNTGTYMVMTVNINTNTNIITYSVKQVPVTAFTP